jgi:hypothetical protein
MTVGFRAEVRAGQILITFHNRFCLNQLARQSPSYMLYTYTHTHRSLTDVHKHTGNASVLLTR